MKHIKKFNEDMEFPINAVIRCLKKKIDRLQNILDDFHHHIENDPIMEARIPTINDKINEFENFLTEIKFDDWSPNQE